MKPINEVKINLLSCSSNEAFARVAVASFIAQLDPTIEEINDIKTAVSEAVTNCIVHAYSERIYTVNKTVRIFENRLVKITVRDRGCGIEDVKKAMEPLYTTAGGERAGLGFAVMGSFMDKLNVRSKFGKGTTVILTKQLSYRTRANG